MMNTFTLCPCGNHSPCEEEKCNYDDSQCDEYTDVDIYNETKTHISISFNKDGSYFGVTIDRKSNKITSFDTDKCQYLDDRDDIVENKSTSHIARISDILNLIRVYKQTYSLCPCGKLFPCNDEKCNYRYCECEHKDIYIITQFIKQVDDEKSSIRIKFKSSLSDSENNSGDDCKYGKYDVKVNIYPDDKYKISCNDEICYFEYNSSNQPEFICSKTEIDDLSFFIDVNVILKLIDLHDAFY